VRAAGLEPILHVTTRDRNRIALVSEALGAQALGVQNLLCTSGTHQTLGTYRAARNVYDIDTIQLLQTYAQLASDCGLVGERGISGAGPFCLGAVASPEADPRDLQLLRLAKKTRAGARFLVTQPVFQVEQFEAWWQEVTRRGLPERVAILAGIQPLTNGHLARAQAGRPAHTRIPGALLGRITARSDPSARRAVAVQIALETVQRLAAFPGLRGFSISADGDDDVALEVIQKSGWGSN
jgi:methylenetetrahydrofolate reductase (NADPH)